MPRSLTVSLLLLRDYDQLTLARWRAPIRA